MHVDGRISGGYAIVCDCGEAFALERIGVAVECPACGHSELGVDVALVYYLGREDRRAEPEADQPGPWRPAAG